MDEHQDVKPLARSSGLADADHLQPALKRQRLSPPVQQAPLPPDVGSSMYQEDAGTLIHEAQEVNDCFQKIARVEASAAPAGAVVKQEAEARWIKLEAQEDAAVAPPRYDNEHFEQHQHQIESEQTQSHPGASLTAAEGVATAGGFGEASNSTSGGAVHSLASHAAVNPSAAIQVGNVDQTSMSSSASLVGHELALVCFVVRVASLRSWATGGASNNLHLALRLLSDQLKDTTTDSLYSLLVSMRSQYRAFNQALTPAGKSTRIGYWASAEDLRCLQKHTQGHRSQWLRHWHDEIYVDFHNAAKTATGSASRVPSAVTMLPAQVNVSSAAAPISAASGSSLRRSAAGLPASGLRAKPPAPPKPAQTSTLHRHGQSSTAAPTTSAQSIVSHVTHSMDPMARRPLRVEERATRQGDTIQRQARQIVELQTTNQRQNAMLSQQRDLLSTVVLQLQKLNTQVDLQARAISSLKIRINNAESTEAQEHNPA